MAKGILPIAKRLADAVLKLGTVNGLRIADPVVPAEMQGNNEFTDMFTRNHAVVRELFFAATVKKTAEARYESAKNALYEAIPTLKSMPVGESKTLVYDNVALAARVQKGQTRIDRQMLLSKLMVDQKMSLDNATAFITAVEKTGSPVIYLTPSVVSE